MPTVQRSSTITALVNHLGASGTLGDPIIELLDTFKLKAHWITQLKGPFINFSSILLAGMNSEPLDNEDDQAIFNDIMGLHLNLHEFVTTLASNKESDGYHNFCQMGFASLMKPSAQTSAGLTLTCDESRR
ncbi:hypothetical protein EI94DRAFT_1812785 [Lactarius quietus]|nr:hypothetical protein EI94DRAFT_1812785 [Lactarius quietus]